MVKERRKCDPTARSHDCQLWGFFRMSYRQKAIAAAVLSLAALAPVSFAAAADLPVKAVKAKPVADLPFFLLIDDRLTYSFIPNATDPGAFTQRPNGTF